MINAHLSSDGFAIIANKRYYFGVGGGTQELKLLLSTCSTLVLEVAKVIEDGGSNVREVLVLKRPPEKFSTDFL
jgi:hypothetical protein